MRRPWAVLTVVTLVWTGGLACAGLGAPAPGPVPAPDETPPPLTPGVQGAAATDGAAAPTTLRFGKPSSWSQDKQQYQADGHPVVHYTLRGEAATVQLILHPPGAPPPDAELERAMFEQNLRAEIPDGLGFDEPVPHTRTLSGQQVTGAIQGMTLRAPDAVVHGEHRSYVVQGNRTSCLVVVDVPDTEHAMADAQVEEVLGNLQVP